MPCYPTLTFEHALGRGRYMAAAGAIEHAGIPIDMEALSTLRARWNSIKDRLIQRIDVDYGVYEGRTFKVDRWRHWLVENDIP